MDNHYHLLVRTPEANLNHAIRWLNVSYVVWFNWKHRRVGHLFQGRYRSEVIEDIAGVSEVGRYAQQLMKSVRVNREQQTSVRRLERSMIDWQHLVQGIERIRGRSWQEMCGQYGDWGRDAVLYAAVRFGGYRLTEVVEKVGGLKYAAAAQAITRFRKRLNHDKELALGVENLKKKVSTI